MITHLLTETDCDDLRKDMLAQAEQAVTTPAFDVWMSAVKLLDRHRSESFKHRVFLNGNIRAKLTAATKPAKTLGLRYSR